LFILIDFTPLAGRPLCGVNIGKMQHYRTLRQRERRGIKVRVVGYEFGS